jgi:hypothetical protein
MTVLADAVDVSGGEETQHGGCSDECNRRRGRQGTPLRPPARRRATKRSLTGSNLGAFARGQVDAASGFLTTSSPRAIV